MNIEKTEQFLDEFAKQSLCSVSNTVWRKELDGENYYCVFYTEALSNDDLIILMKNFEVAVLPTPNGETIDDNESVLRELGLPLSDIIEVQLTDLKNL